LRSVNTSKLPCDASAGSRLSDDPIVAVPSSLVLDAPTANLGSEKTSLSFGRPLSRMVSLTFSLRRQNKSVQGNEIDENCTYMDNNELAYTVDSLFGHLVLSSDGKKRTSAPNEIKWLIDHIPKECIELSSIC
jgi:hypothetical protein